MADGRAALGRWGEDLAARHLAATGARVLDRNWRCKEGELDVVAVEPGGVLVFCEVKTRSSARFGTPVDAVDRVRARRLRAAARRYLAEQHPAGVRQVRFDVIGVLRAPGQPVRVVHLRGAF